MPEPKKRATSGPSRRGVGAAREKRSASHLDPDAPRRSSLRIRGEKADGRHVVEEKHGKLITTEGAFDPAKGSGWRPQEGRAADDVVRARHPPGLVAFASLNRGDDARYLRLLREAAGGGGGAGGGEENKEVVEDEDEDAPILQRKRSAASDRPAAAATSSSFASSLAAAAAAAPAAAAASAASPSTAAAFASSTLLERDVVKVVRDGCVHLAWHPGGGNAILASADKKGAVSLFDADWASSSSLSSPSAAGEAGTEAGADEAGVLEFAPHHSYVCGLKWAGGGRLFTASYDGSVRVLDPSFRAPPPPGRSNLGTAGGDVDKTNKRAAALGGVFAPAILHAEAEWSAFDCSDDGRLAIVADKGGEALLFDPRAGAASAVSAAAAADAAAAVAAAARTTAFGDDGSAAPRRHATAAARSAAATTASGGDGSAAPPPRPATAHPPRPTSALPKCVVAAFSLHEKKINTLSIDCSGGGNLFAASASDGSIQIFDLRKLIGSASSSPSPSSSGKIKCDLGTDSSKRAKIAKPVMAGGHVQSCQGAFFAPDGSGRLVSTSRDNTVKIWSTKADSALETPLVSIRHDNNTGRWITPFRAVFTPRGDGVVLGGMRRTIDVYSSADGRQLAALRSDFMTAIGSRVAMHSERAVLAAATASGRVNVWRNE